jgi:hypothetical protein
MSDLKIDLETMGRLASALSFIASPDDPAVLALRAAVASGDAKDVKQARTLFLQVKPAHRNAALAMLGGGD